MVVAPVGMAVAGQVDGDKGAAQGQAHGVPRVRVLRTTVEQHQLGPLGPGPSPDQGAEAAAPLHLHRATLHLGGAVPRQAELLGVLAQHPELLIGGGAHRRAL